MKVPPDALVEWRCLKCAKPFGYLRIVNGVVCVTTMREKLDAGPDGGPLLALEEDLPLSELMTDAGIPVCCGRHRGWVTLGQTRPSGVRKRKVMIEPWSARLTTRHQGPADRSPLPPVRRSGSLE